MAEPDTSLPSAVVEDALSPEERVANEFSEFLGTLDPQLFLFQDLAQKAAALLVGLDPKAVMKVVIDRMNDACFNWRLKINPRNLPEASLCRTNFERALLVQLAEMVRALSQASTSAQPQVTGGEVDGTVDGVRDLLTEVARDNATALS